MINEKNVKSYCKEDIALIENYDKAIADDSQVWDCHHRNEIKVLPSGITVICSSKELIENGRYFKCPANELIFLTPSEHNRLHNKGNTYRVGKTMTAESRRKMSVAKKGNTYNKGKTNSVFGKAFKEHYGITRCDNVKLYYKEYKFYKLHNNFSWEE